MVQRGQTQVALPEENLPLWQRLPEGLRQAIIGAMGGVMIALLLGAGFIWC